MCERLLEAAKAKPALLVLAAARGVTIPLFRGSGLECPTTSRSMLELDPPLELACALMEFSSLFEDGYL